MIISSSHEVKKLPLYWLVWSQGNAQILYSSSRGRGVDTYHSNRWIIGSTALSKSPLKARVFTRQLEKIMLAKQRNCQIKERPQIPGTSIYGWGKSKSQGSRWGQELLKTTQYLLIDPAANIRTWWWSSARNCGNASRTGKSCPFTLRIAHLEYGSACSIKQQLRLNTKTLREKLVISIQK